MSKSCVDGSALQVERLPDGRRKVLRDFIVCVDGHRIKVPKDFDMDYSSIPTVIQWIVHWTKVDIAGVMHDWLYRHGHFSSRRYVDWIWWKIARRGERHANWLQASLCWLGMRLFSFCTWHKYIPLRKKYQETKEMTPQEPKQSCAGSVVVQVVAIVALTLLFLQHYSCESKLSLDGVEWKIERTSE